MRIRTIKPEFWTNDELADLDPLVRLLFIGLWNMADCRGRLEDRPKRIKAAIMPYDDIDVHAALDTLMQAGFIRRYQVGGIEVVQVVNFEKHQRITGKEAEAESSFPAEFTRETPGKRRGNTRETTETTEGRKEGKEGKERNPPLIPQASPDPAAAATETASPGSPDLPAPADAGSGKGEAPAPDPAEDPEVAELMGEGVVVPTDEELHAWAKAWPGFPALGIPAGIDAAWLDRQLAWYAQRRKPFPRDWRRDIELEYRQAWRLGKVKPSPNNGGPPVAVAVSEADTSTLPKSFAKLDPESQRLVLKIRAGCPQRWQRREDIAWWQNKAAEYDGGSLDGSPEHQRALRIVAALEAP